MCPINTLAFVFLVTNSVEHPFMCVFAIPISSVVKCLFKSCACLKNCGFSLLTIEFLFCIHGCKTLHQIFHLQYSLPAYVFLFNLLYVFLGGKAEFLDTDKIKITDLSLFSFRTFIVYID